MEQRDTPLVPGTDEPRSIEGFFGFGHRLIAGFDQQVADVRWRTAFRRNDFNMPRYPNRQKLESMFHDSASWFQRQSVSTV